MGPVSTSTSVELAYAEGVRALEGQERQVQELRQRTGLLLTGASITTSLLGSPLARDDAPEVLAGLAIVFFVGVVGCCLWIIRPRKKVWKFSMDPRMLVEDWVDQDPPCGDGDDMTKYVAKKHGANFADNQELLEDLYKWFLAAAVFLGAEVFIAALFLAW